MADKRKSTTTSNNNNKKVKKIKSGLSKESFLREIQQLRLFVEGDRYYDTQIDDNGLKLCW